jgi:PAS domain S-box-containing protein
MALEIAERKRVEDELRAAEQKYRVLVEQIPAVTYIWETNANPEASGYYTSPRIEQLLGFTVEEWHQDPDFWLTRVHPDDRTRVTAATLRSETTGEPFSLEYRYLAKDGHVVWVLDEAVLLVRDERAQPRTFHGVMLDITARKEAEEALRRSEELFRLTFERVGVGMSHVAPDGRWLRINDTLCEILGYSREELLGKTYLDLTPPEDRGAGAERVRCLLEGKIGPYTVERRYIRKDGSRVWVNLSVSLVRKASGEPDFLVCVAEDITGRKLGELVPDSLTDREIEVLQLIARWQTNQEIACRLAYSTSTIKSYVQSILNKLGVKSRREAVAKAMRIGLIAPPR